MTSSSPDFAQAARLLETARKPAVLVVPHASDDAFSAMLALGIILQTQNPRVRPLLLSPTHVPPHLMFLPASSQVLTNWPPPPALIIRLPYAGVSVKTSRLGGETVLRVTASKEGDLNPQAVSVQPEDSAPDLIVTCGVGELKQLGSLYTKRPALFRRVPLLAFDCYPPREYFARVSLIDLTAAAICEIVWQLILKSGWERSVDRDLATCLLAGLMAQTYSFRTPAVTARTLETAAALLQHRARRELIVEFLFRRRALANFRLLGLIFSLLEENRWQKAYTAVLRHNTLKDNSVTPSQLEHVLQNIARELPEDFNFLCLAEVKPNQFCVFELPGSGRVRPHPDGSRPLLTATLAAPNFERACQALAARVARLAPPPPR
jgi:nanoRNase/pAp phosphatase (c-di-AMP/oligoRNAs hydrolase)